MSVEQGVAEIPTLLKEETVFAIMLGGGYDDEAFGKIKEAVGNGPVPWLRPDKTKPGPKDLGPGYPKIIAERAKAGLDNISGSGIAFY
jgi:hypothetical protein